MKSRMIKNRFVNSVMLVTLVVAVVAGCGEQEKSVETVEFGEEVVTSSTATTVDETNETAVAQTVESEQASDYPAEEHFVYQHVENPGWDYYLADETLTAGEQTVHLEKLEETPNGVSDLQQWVADNQLDFQAMPYEDEKYVYNTFGDNAFDTYELLLKELSGEEREITLDFSDYNYANDFEEEEKAFVFQRIIWAKVEENILYVATGHYTYAASSPHNAYITAIDMDDFHVLWKTSPLVCNSLSFEIVGDAIICGYGFTAEDDFLYILDKKTGVVQEAIPLKKAPEYIYRKDDILYVKTYDADLRFQILEEGK